MVEQEGVVKFQLDFQPEPLQGFDIDALNAWRTRLMALGLIGAVEDRYGGFGFGNLSFRTTAGFLITGSQTGHIPSLELAHCAEVTLADTERNAIVARGETRPSSESLTHAAVYTANPGINAVFHVHSPDIWRQVRPATDRDIAYGTPAMARAVAALVVSKTGLFVMAGHEDGVVSYGTDCQTAGLLLTEALES